MRLWLSFWLCQAARLRQADVENDQHRLACLRQDNLELLSIDSDPEEVGYSQHDAYVIQKVISGLQSSESLDAYVFCRKMMLDSLQAVLVLKMTDDYVEFSLAEHKGGSEGLASAKVYLEGFEIFTRSTTVSWLKYLAANQEVLHKGMHGNVSLRLTGRLRPVKRKGFWKVELISGNMDSFEAEFPGGSTLLNRAISTFGSTLVLNQILELVRRSVPAKLLDVMTKLHSTGADLQARIALVAQQFDADQELIVESSVGLELGFRPDTLLDVVARHAPGVGLTMAQVMSRCGVANLEKAFKEQGSKGVLRELSLHGFAVSWDGARTVARDKSVKSLEHLLTRLIRTSDLHHVAFSEDAVLRALAPLVQAHREGQRGLLDDFKVRAKLIARWLPEERVAFSLTPSTQHWRDWRAPEGQLIEVRRSFLEAIGLWDSLVLKNSSLRLDGLDFDSRVLDLDHGEISNWKYVPKNKSQPPWEVRHGKLDRARIELPEAWAQRFSLKTGYAELTADAKVALWTKGLEAHYMPEFVGPPSANQTTLSGLYMRLDGETFENVTGLSVSASYWAHLPLKSMLQQALTQWEREDFGYHSFLGLMTLLDQHPRNPGKGREVLVVLNCRYLRIFDWPLAKKQDRLAAIEVDLRVESLDMTAGHGDLDECFYVSHKTSGILGSYRLSTLCAKDLDLFWKAVYALGERHPIKNLAAAVWGASTKKNRSSPPSPLSTKSPWWNEWWDSLQQMSGREVRQDDPVPKVLPDVAWKGSKEMHSCRAEEDLDLLWPGRLLYRKAFKSAVGDVFLKLEGLQLLQADLKGRLWRKSATRFSFELTGPEGQADLQLYVEGIDFHTPDSSLLGFVKKLGYADWLLGRGSLHDGPLTARFKLSVDLILIKEHWHAQPGALSDVKVTFGRGGPVQTAINSLIGSFGKDKVDQFLLDYVWPLLSHALQKTILELGLHEGRQDSEFKITARCHQRKGERCGSDLVEVEIRDHSELYLPAAPKSKEQGTCAYGGIQSVEGVASVVLSITDELPAKVSLSTQGLAPLETLNCFNRSAKRLLLKGGFTSEASLFESSQVEMEGLQLPINGETLVLSGVVSDLEIPSGLDFSATHRTRAELDVEVEEARGLRVKELHKPVFSVELTRAYMQGLYEWASRFWARPKNVRSGAAARADGRLPAKFQRPRRRRSLLDFASLLQGAHGDARLTLEGKDHVDGRLALVLSMTLRFTKETWRAMLNRRQFDYGYVHLSVVGTWQTSRETRALLEIGCGRLRIHKLEGAAPFGKGALLYSMELQEIVRRPASFKRSVVKKMGSRACWSAFADFLGPAGHFCSEVAKMEELEEALLLQLSRFNSIRASMVAAQEADVKSANATGMSYSGSHKVFSDGTWFRRYNPLDTSSWFPELPPEV